MRVKPRHAGLTTKSHASGKIKNRSFRILRIGSDVFFDADSESPHMTLTGDARPRGAGAARAKR